MKNILCLILAYFIILSGCDSDRNTPVECGLKEETATHFPPASVLFLGTSHTFYNDLPQLTKLIAQAAGDNLYIEMSAPPEYDFERHFKLNETQKALSSRKWDYVILQESGWRTALPDSIAENKIYPFADSLLALIKQNNGSAKLILYMTNGYIGGVNALGEAEWCKEDPQVCNYEGMQDRIMKTYLRLSNIMKAEIAPCGAIWKILRSKKPNIELHDPDNIHPALLGSYSNAITLYTLIRKKIISERYIPLGVTKEQADLVQSTVSDVLFKCDPSWKEF